MTEEKRGNPDSEEPSSKPDSGGDSTLGSDPNATVGLTGGVAFSGEKPGTVIGRYKLLQAIGEGGFGTVFKAEQLEPVSRLVALKIIKLGMDTKQVIGRFEAERQALALMDHPGIARVFDAGTTDRGRPYFVMELVKGIPITAYCDRNRLSTRARLELFKQVCAAVQHAHQKGVIHRDLKPSNVLVSDTDGQPAPKVIDFGIAKATNQRLTEMTVFTQLAQFIGTPAYMSPEQAGVTETDIDTRSDIYSLGVLLYELLSGATPFDGQKLRSAGYGEIQRIIREEEPPLPSTRAGNLGQLLEETAEHRRLRGHQLVRNLKGELDWIVMKCLEKDRTRRYETANGLAADVERYLGNEPVTASPPSRTYRLKKLVARNRVVFAAGTAMVALLAAGMVGTGIGLVRAKVAEKEAISEAAKSDQVAVFLTQMLAGVGPSAARGRDTEMLEEILQETDERLTAELADQPEVEGEIRSHLGTTYYDLGQFEKAKDQFNRSLELLRKVHGEPDGDVARQYNNLGLAHESLQENEEAEWNHRKALELRRQLYGEVNEDVANNLVNLANLLVGLGRYQEAEPMLLEALDSLRKLHGDNNEDVAICLNSLGNLMQHLSRYEEAGPYYQEALTVHREVLGADHPYVITDMVNMGYLAMNTSQYDTASARFAEAVELSRRVYGDSHPKLIDALKAQAKCEERIGHLDESYALYREAWDLADVVFGPDHLSTADVMSDMSTLLTAMDRDQEADELIHRVYEIQKTQLGPNHPSTLTTLHNIAYAVYTRGDYEEAAGLFRKSVASYTETYGRESDQTALALTNLGRSLRGLGDLDEAVECFEEALAIRTRVFGADHLSPALTNHDLALTLRAQGHFAEAEELMRSAVTRYVALVDSTFQAISPALRELAFLELEQGRPEEALDHALQSRRMWVESRGDKFEDTAVFDVIAAAALGQLGRLPEAQSRLEELLPRIGELKSRPRALIEITLGRHQALSGEYQAAEATLLDSYGVFNEKFGDAHPLTRQTMEAMVYLYDTWALAGSAHAETEAARWRDKLAVS